MQSLYLVCPRSSHQTVDAIEIDYWEFIEDETAFHLVFLVHQFDNAGYIQWQHRAIDLLFLRVITHADNLRLFIFVLLLPRGNNHKLPANRLQRFQQRIPELAFYLYSGF